MRKKVEQIERVIKLARRDPEGTTTWRESFGGQTQEDRELKEEQKVASLVAGSRLHAKLLDEMFAAIRGWDGRAEDAVDPKANPALKAAIRAARRAMIPEAYV